MAKLNGFELKNIKNFLGHEQEPLQQGNIYYKGKKVGFWSQDAHGGEDNVDIDYQLSKELQNEIWTILNTYKCGSVFNDNEYDFKGGEWLFQDLIDLINYEKDYKKYIKKWNDGSTIKISAIAFLKENWQNTKIMGGIDKQELELRIKVKGLNNLPCIIFTSLNDFERTVA